MSSPLLSFPIGLLVFFPMSYTQNMYLYTNLPQPTRFDQRWKPTVAETAPNCPRCDSPNTKFCYYNNYSLTQPRYFCKACRRYWTKGGSLRNVPVGGACRKSRKRHAKPSRYVPNYSDKPNSSRSLRPDLALNGKVVSGPSINGSSNGTSDCIDLEVLYSKYLKPGQATAVVGDQGLGSGLDESEEDPTAFGLQVSDSPNFSGTVDANLAWQHEQLQQEEMDIVDCMLSDMQHQDLMGVDWMSFGAS